MHKYSKDHGSIGDFILSFITDPAFFVMLVLPLLFACSGDPYRLRNVAKTEIDLVADAHYQEIDRLMRLLTIKLYKRNPIQLAKNPDETIESRMERIFSDSVETEDTELGGKRGLAAMELCFDPKYSGDRVFALVTGLNDMVRQSYDNHAEFFITSSLDLQKLYNSARNIEILVWRLSNKTDEKGNLFLLTNGEKDGVANLSFERLFGKMIAIQDMMSRIMQDRTNRLVNKIVQSAATAVFLPVGI